MFFSFTVHFVSGDQPTQIHQARRSSLVSNHSTYHTSTFSDLMHFSIWYAFLYSAAIAEPYQFFCKYNWASNNVGFVQPFYTVVHRCSRYKRNCAKLFYTRGRVLFFFKIKILLHHKQVHIWGEDCPIEMFQYLIDITYRRIELIHSKSDDEFGILACLATFTSVSVVLFDALPILITHKLLAWMIAWNSESARRTSTKRIGQRLIIYQ